MNINEGSFFETIEKIDQFYAFFSRKSLKIFFLLRWSSFYGYYQFLSNKKGCYICIYVYQININYKDII